MTSVCGTPLALSCRTPARGHQEQQHGGDPDGPGPAGNEGTGGAPYALLPLQAGDDFRLALGLREQLGAERPERGAAQQRHQRRQQGQRGEERAEDARGRHGAEGLVGVEIGEQQAEERDDDRGAGGNDGFPRIFPRGQHGGRAVGGVRQGLAEPGHVEQRVVRGGADHQDGQDALALAVELDPAELGHAEDQQDGGAEGEDRGEEDGNRQQQRAVDNQQDHEHRTEGHEQQDAVNAGEGADQVRRQPGRTGHEGLHALRGGRLHLVAELLDDFLHFRRPNRSGPRTARLWHPRTEWGR